MSKEAQHDRAFLTGKEIEGQRLDQRLAAGAMAPGEAVRCALAIGAELQQAHGRGMVHGALSTSRVALTESGAQVLEPVPGAGGALTRFSAPEQARGLAADTRSDIFSFGAILYESVTGRPAFPGERREDLVRSILETEPPPVSALLRSRVPADAQSALKTLDAVVCGCLTKDPDRRRQRIQNALIELKLVVRPLGKLAQPPVEPSTAESERQAASRAIPRPVPIERRTAIDPGTLAASPRPPARIADTGARPFVVLPPPERTAAPAVPSARREAPSEAPPAAGFVTPEPKPAGSPAAPVMETRPARREIRLAKLLPKLAPMLEDDLGRAAATSPEEEAPNPAQPSAPAQQQPETAPRPSSPEVAAPPVPATPEPAPLRTRSRQVEPSPRPTFPDRGSYAPGEVTYTRGMRARFLLIGGVVLLIAAAVIGAVLYLARTHQPQVLKFAVPPPEHGSYPGTPAVSPDGHYLAFSAAGPEGRRMLWLRPLDELHSTVIPGTEGGSAPFWSPDSQDIAFFADKALKKVRASGGNPQTLCEVEGFTGGGTWNRDNVIVFAPGLAGGLFRIHAGGGRPEPVTELSEPGRERAHLWPRFLPDGKHFTFYGLTDFEDTSGVYVGALGSRTTRRVMESDSNAVFSAARASDANPGQSRDGYLLFIRNRGLYAQAFNTSGAELTGIPFLLAEDVGSVRSMALAPVSVSDNGVLVYQALGKPSRQLIWFDRGGRQVSTLGEPGDFGPPRISPDGKSVAVARTDPGKETANIWVYHEDGSATQVTSSAAHEGSPVWSPDGSRLAYFSDAEGNFNLYVKSVHAGRSETLVKDRLAKYTSDWSRDARFVLFGTIDRVTGSDIWVAHTATRRTYPLLQTINSEGYAALSPDGRWIAYQTDSEGKAEIFVQAFRPEGGGTERRYQISAGGGGLPRWRDDGKEIFFITSSGRLMAAAVRPGDETFQAAPPQILFQTRPVPKTWNLFDVTADGRRFLVNVPLEWSSSAAITVVSNWTQKVRR